jgi:hypothetical protein
MSIVLLGSTSGSCTLQEQAIAGTTTLTLPTTSGTVLTTGSTAVVTQSMLTTGVGGTGPAFSVSTNDGSGYFNYATTTKIRFNAEIFDTNNCYDTSNYRFTPNVEGYYHFTLKVLNNFSPPGQVISYLFKNGGGIAEFVQIAITQQGQGTACSYLAYANGTTDYFEAYYYQDKGNGLGIYTGSQQTYWVGHMVRGA